MSKWRLPTGPRHHLQGKCFVPPPAVRRDPASRGTLSTATGREESPKVETQLQARKQQVWASIAQGLRKADALPVAVWLEGRGIQNTCLCIEATINKSLSQTLESVTIVSKATGTQWSPYLPHRWCSPCQSQKTMSHKSLVMI